VEAKPQPAQTPADDPAELKAQLTALQHEVVQLKLEKLSASVNKGERRQGNHDRQHYSQEMGRRQGRDATAQECA